MNKFIYLTLSFLLCSTLISSLMDFIIQVLNPIFFYGGSGGIMKYYKNSTNPELLYLSDYPHSCSGVWSCSKMMQNLYNKHEGEWIIALNLNPVPNNITQQIEASSNYYITFYSILFSMICLGFSILFGLLINICIKKPQKFIPIGPLSYSDEEDVAWTKTKKILYGVLFILRIPIYLSIILIYTYMLPDLFIDELPSNIIINNYIRTFTLLSAYIIDNFVFPYEMLN